MVTGLQKRVTPLGSAFVAVVVMVMACLVPAIARDPQYLQVDMPSQVLTQFWQQPVSISAHILLPDSYYKEPSRRYPVM
jgi:hypothetical protein